MNVDAFGFAGHKHDRPWRWVPPADGRYVRQPWLRADVPESPWARSVKLPVSTSPGILTAADLDLAIIALQHPGLEGLRQRYLAGEIGGPHDGR